MNEGRIRQERTIEQSHPINEYTERYNQAERELMNSRVPVVQERRKHDNVVDARQENNWLSLRQVFVFSFSKLTVFFIVVVTVRSNIFTLL